VPQLAANLRFNYKLLLTKIKQCDFNKICLL